jgi:NAD(P)-dependent dehydrogenase (short-subunit alcohol dehydrogenase family)
MLIETGSLTRQSLAGQVAVVTGAGGGIGFEAARALVWLGAHVVIAEINRHTGREAAARLMKEWGADTVTFVHTDVGDQRSVNGLARQVLHSLGKVDIVLNNATIAPLGAVAVCNPVMRQRANDLGECIRQEDGVGKAVDVIEAHVGLF